MSSKLYKLKSKSFSFNLLGEHPAHFTEVGKLRIFELYAPPEIGSNGLGDYQLVIEGEVGDESLLEEIHQEAVSLAEKLELLWTYVWSTPLHTMTRGLTLVPVAAPEGWQTNKDHIQKEYDLEKGGLSGTFSFSRRESWQSNSLPLERAMRILSKYEDVNPTISKLIDFHFESLTAKSTHSCVLLLSKCLEICKAILLGKNNTEKEKSLPDDVRAELKNSFHKLFELANTRLDTRHPVTRHPDEVKLNPELEISELDDYFHDCDIIVRGIVCEYFGEDFVIARSRKVAPNAS